MEEPKKTEQDPNTEEVTFTEEQQAKVDEIVKRSKAQATKNLMSDEQVQEKVREALDNFKKEQEQAKKVSEMSEADRRKHDAEQLQQERDDLAKQVSELQQAQLHTQLTAEASKILSAKGVTPDERTLSFVVKDNVDDTQEAIDSLVELIDEKAEAKRQAGLRGYTPRSSNGNNVQTYTKDEFMNLSTAEKVAYKKANPTGYEQIMQG